MKTFYFKPAPITLDSTPCSCPYKNNVHSSDLKIVCGHVEHAGLNVYLNVNRIPRECVQEVCKKAVRGWGAHHHHEGERERVMKKLLDRLRKDKFVHTLTQDDGTQVWESRT